MLEWPSLTVEWWTDEFVNSDLNMKDDKTLCYVTYGTHTSGEEKNYLVMAKVYLPNQQYIKKLYRDSKYLFHTGPIKASDAIKKNDSSME